MFKACVTGHRPKLLPWKYNEKSTLCFVFKLRLARKIKTLVKMGCKHFISGMAMGVDMIFAEIVLKLKKKYKLVLEAAIPCNNQTKGWTFDYVERYNKIVSQCDVVTYVSKVYSSDCMMKRNKYMVDHSDFVVVVYRDGVCGGTKNTIDYAISKNKKIYYVKL